MFSYESISIASCNIVKSSIFMNSNDSNSWAGGMEITGKLCDILEISVRQ